MATGDAPPRGQDRLFYRVIERSEPAIEDFLSNAAKKRRPRGPEHANRFIYEGISVQDSLQGAEKLARQFSFQLGSHVAELAIPDSAEHVEIRKTLGPGHYTIKGPAEALLALVRATFALK